MRTRSISVQRLPQPPDSYDKEYMERLVYAIGVFMDMASSEGRVVISSPNGKKWTITVDNSGNVGAE